jgi:CRP-like cAMP-binding protein
MKKLSEFQLFSGLNLDAVERITGNLTRRKYKKGEHIIKQGTKAGLVYILVEGRVGIQAQSKEGLRTTLIFHEAPHIMGHVELWRDKPSLANVVAIEKCEALELSKKDYLTFLQSNHQLTINMVKSLSNLIYDTARNTHVRMFGEVDHLIANTLCSFARLYGEQRASGVLIQREISKSELAAILGVARQTVIRALQGLERDGLIQVEGKDVLIPNLEALQQKAFTAVV